MTNNNLLHEIAITAIIIKDGKYLITKRSPNKKRFPGKWTVPGGKLEVEDYINLPKDTEFYWYNVLEKVIRREVKEEVGLEINNIEYVTSLATVHTDGNPSLVVSCMADYVEGEVKLQKDETDDFAWITLDEAKDYDLIDGIYDELVMTENKILPKHKLRVSSPRKNLSSGSIHPVTKATGVLEQSDKINRVKSEWQRN